MKLYLLEINNGWDYADYDEKHKLIAAEDISSATVMAVEFMHENYDTDKYAVPSFDVLEIKKVGGYKIILEKVTE